MSKIPMNKAAIGCLVEVRDSMRHGGLHLYPSTGFFSNSTMQVTLFRALAGRGLVNVIDSRIVITEAGLEFLDGVP